MGVLKKKAFWAVVLVLAWLAYAVPYLWYEWKKAQDRKRFSPTQLEFYVSGSSLHRNPEEFVQWLEYFGLTAPARKFELTTVPAEYSGVGSANHWLTHFSGMIRQAPKLVPELERIAAERFPTSPGVALLLAFGRHGVDGQSWRPLMNEQWELLEGSPESEKAGLASYLNDRVYTSLDCPELSRWIWDHWNAELRAKVDALLGKEPEAVDFASFDRYLAEAVKHRQFDYGLEMLKRWIERQRPLVPPAERTRLAKNRVSELFNGRKRYSPNRFWWWQLTGIEPFEFQFAVARDPDLALCEGSFSMPLFLFQYEKKRARWIPLDERSRIRKLQWIGTRLEDHPLRTLAIPPAYHALLSGTDREERHRPVEMAKQADGPGSWLLHELAELGKNAHESLEVPHAGIPARLSRYFRDPELPLPVRLKLVNWNFDNAEYPQLMEKEVMLEFLDVWEEALYPGPDSRIPIEMAEVANRAAMAIRALRGRKDWDLDRGDLEARATRLKKAVQQRIESEKRELTTTGFDDFREKMEARVAKNRSGPVSSSGPTFPSGFWPACFSLLLSEGRVSESLELWEWMYGNYLEFVWSRPWMIDGLHDEKAFLQLIAVTAMEQGGLEGLTATMDQIDEIMERTDREQPEKVRKDFVLGLRYGLGPADRVRLRAAWLANPPWGIDPEKEMRSVRWPHPPSLKKRPETIRPERTREEEVREFVRDLLARPIESQTAPLVLSEVFQSMMKTGGASVEATRAWLASEFDPAEIEASVVLRELNRVLDGKGAMPENRQLAVLEDRRLSSRSRFLKARDYWNSLNYRDSKSWPNPPDEDFRRLTRAMCGAALEEVERGENYPELFHYATLPFALEALAQLQENDPEAAGLVARFLKNAPMILQNIEMSGSRLWINALFGLAEGKDHRVATLRLIRGVGEVPAMASYALERALKSGFHEEAGRIFEQNWKRIDLKRPSLPTSLRFDRAFLAMADSIEDDDVRFLGELHVSWLMDPPIDPGSATVPWGTARKRRLEKLAGQFREREFIDGAAREAALETLISLPATRSALEEEFRKELGDLPSLLEHPSDEAFALQWQLWKVHLASLIEESGIAVFESLVPSRDWFGAESVRKGGKPTRQEQVWLGFFEAFRAGLESIPEDGWDKAERVFDTLEVIPWIESRTGGSSRTAPSETAGFVTTHSVRRYAGTRLAFDVARGAGNPGGWLASLPADVSDPGFNRFNMHLMALSYLGTARKLSPVDEATPEARHEAVGRFLEAPLPVRMFGPETQRYFLLRFCGWFNRDEILAFGLEDAEKDPRGGHAFGDLATEFQSKDRELARHLMQRALEMLDPDDKSWPVRGYHSMMKRFESWKQQAASDPAAPEAEK